MNPFNIIKKRWLDNEQDPPKRSRNMAIGRRNTTMLCGNM
jgi:hypothetical protein